MRHHRGVGKRSDIPVPRRPYPDLALALGVMGWIAVVLILDRARPAAIGFGAQSVLGVITWGVLAIVLRRESPLVRAQTVIVVLIATAVEYTFSPLLEVYSYRLGTVPIYVPPGHGLVYLAALALGRTRWMQRHLDAAVLGTVVVCGAWATWGITGAARRDELGFIWFICLLGFLRWGRAPGLYVGAFLVVSWLELVGTGLGSWRWATVDPLMGVVEQGNPPSGAAGGYGWFDLYAGWGAPVLLAAFNTLRAGSWRRPLVTSTEPAPTRSAPSIVENLPPASTTTGTSAATSCSARSGSQAMSTAPSATSMYDQKSP